MDRGQRYKTYQKTLATAVGISVALHVIALVWLKLEVPAFDDPEPGLDALAAAAGRSRGRCELWERDNAASRKPSNVPSSAALRAALDASGRLPELCEIYRCQNYKER